jgi:uncharacterized protein YukE
LAAAHLRSDNRIESAHAGWQGAPAAAMRSKMAAWVQTSAVMLTRMSEHAQSLHTAAQGFATNEQDCAQEFAQLAQFAQPD